MVLFLFEHADVYQMFVLVRDLFYFILFFCFVFGVPPSVDFFVVKTICCTMQYEKQQPGQIQIWTFQGPLHWSILWMSLLAVYLQNLTILRCPP